MIGQTVACNNIEDLRASLAIGTFPHSNYETFVPFRLTE